MSIYTSALLSLCNYTTKTLVGSGVCMLPCWVPLLLFPRSLLAHFKQTVRNSLVTETERLLMESESIDTTAVFSFPEISATQKTKGRYRRRPSGLEPEMRCYRGDLSQFLRFVLPWQAVTFFGTCMFGYGEGSMQMHKLAFRVFFSNNSRSGIESVCTIIWRFWYKPQPCQSSWLFPLLRKNQQVEEIRREMD